MAKAQDQTFVSVDPTVGGSAAGSGPSCPDVSTGPVPEADGVVDTPMSTICRSAKR